MLSIKPVSPLETIYSGWLIDYDTEKRTVGISTLLTNANRAGKRQINDLNAQGYVQSIISIQRTGWLK